MPALSQPREASPRARRPSVLVVGADRATLELLAEWLAEAGWRVAESRAEEPTLVLVDLPYPRLDAGEALQRIRDRHAGIPVLALSTTVHAGVPMRGTVADSLGVAGVLPKPVEREALIRAVRCLSRP